MTDKSYTKVTKVTDGSIPRAVFVQVQSWIAQQKNEQRVVIEVKRWHERHSDRQRGYWFGVIVPAFMDCCGYSKDSAHDALMWHLWPEGRKDEIRLDGTMHSVRGSLTDVDGPTMAELIERAFQFAVKEYGLLIPSPGEWTD